MCDQMKQVQNIQILSDLRSCFRVSPSVTSSFYQATLTSHQIKWWVMMKHGYLQTPNHITSAIVKIMDSFNTSWTIVMMSVMMSRERGGIISCVHPIPSITPWVSLTRHCKFCWKLSSWFLSRTWPQHSPNRSPWKLPLSPLQWTQSQRPTWPSPWQ